MQYPAPVILPCVLTSCTDQLIMQRDQVAKQRGSTQPSSLPPRNQHLQLAILIKIHTAVISWYIHLIYTDTQDHKLTMSFNN